MASSTVELMNKGMECLKNNLGVVDAEMFISLIIREKFDYTRWQREYFDNMESGEFNEKAVEYAKDHPFKGNAQKL
ncbi:hypothetical protein [Butyrivibrio sp. VCD2006]|uniref:hypothetical protein n=1 Tax=Butyrivibrio sp. VCD2006 TaxID=1280664 RepID=UPI0003FE433A|nr:hypothetical protein [Butyrivibrio sp. VCD2006]